MTAEQARDLQAEMYRLDARIRSGHFEPEDARILAMTLAEILAHVASAIEARRPGKKF